MARGLNFGFRKKRDCTICIVKTKALISCAVIVQLICAFVFTYAKSRFSHDAAQMLQDGSLVWLFRDAIKNLSILTQILSLFLLALFCLTMRNTQPAKYQSKIETCFPNKNAL